MPILDWIAENMPWTPIAQGIRAKKQDEFMQQYRQQMMQQQATQNAQLQQQQGAAKQAWQSFPDQALVTPQVTSQNQLQQNKQAVAGHDWGLLNNLPTEQRPIWKALSDADPLAALTQLGQQAKATAQENFTDFGPQSDPFGMGGAGQRNTVTGQISNYQKPPSPTAGQSTFRQMSAEELQQWGLPAGTVAALNEQTGKPDVIYKPDLRESSDLNARTQQGPAFLLPDGDVVAGEFTPNGGYGYRKGGELVPLPDGARPTTPSTGGLLTPKQFLDLREKFTQEQQALERLNEYGKSVGGMPVGIKNWAAAVTAKFRTALGSKTLNPEEFKRMTAEGQLQALLGLFRTDVVGPGVMTEYDAQRVMQALGGNVGMLQNPQVVEKLLSDIYANKMERVKIYQSEIERNRPGFKTDAMPITAPEQFTGTGGPTEEWERGPDGQLRRKQ